MGFVALKHIGPKMQAHVPIDHYRWMAEEACRAGTPLPDVIREVVATGIATIEAERLATELRIPAMAAMAAVAAVDTVRRRTLAGR